MRQVKDQHMTLILSRPGFTVLHAVKPAGLLPARLDVVVRSVLATCRSAFGKHAWNVTFAINWVIFVVILVFGGGFGIWAAIKGRLCVLAN